MAMSGLLTWNFKDAVGVNVGGYKLRENQIANLRGKWVTLAVYL